MADWRHILRLSLHITWSPVPTLLSLAISLLVAVVAPIWSVIAFVSLPFAHLAHAVFGVTTFPLRAQWLARIETFYIYFGTAALIGCLTGAIVFAIFSFISSSLNIDSAIVPRPKDPSRSTADTQADHREKRERLHDQPPLRAPVVLNKMPGSRRKGLLSQAIMEEEDSDF
ncbi:hypothetical protein ACEQ8H_000330 [Pleosporales sp. CAS-2024a]